MDVIGWEKPVVGLLVTVFQIAFRCVYDRFSLCLRALFAVFQHCFRKSREWSVSLRACSSDIADLMWC